MGDRGGETARGLGHAFICAGPTVGADPVAAYAQADIAGLETVTMHGTCSVHPNVTEASYFLGCRQRVDPNPAVGLLGGEMMQLATSGSVTSAYLIPAPGKTLPASIDPGPAPPHGSLPNPPDFYRVRVSATDRAGNPGSWATRITTVGTHG